MPNTNRRRRGRGKRILFGTVIVLALLWCGYWYAVSRIADAGIGRVVAALSAGGSSLTCTDAGMSGFPLRLDLRCSDAKFARASDHTAAALAGASASALLYSPGSVEASIAGPITFDAPELGGSLKASWSEASARIDAGLSGLNSLGATLAAFVIEANGESPRLPFRHLAMARGSLATGPAPDDGYRLAGAASDLVLERSSGGAFPAISAEFAIVAEKFGSASGLDPAKALQAWIAKGGALKVERLAFSTGAVSASATGTLVMAPTGLLSGRLVVRITGLEQLPDIAEELKPGSRDRVARIIGGIGAFTKPVNDGSGAREIDLLVADGAIFAGMFPLPFVIPAVRF